MASAQSPTFGQLLKHYRLVAGLTQEALAERAGISARGISDIERGLRRAPYRDTINKLAQALELSAADCARLEAATQRSRPPSNRPSAHTFGTIPSRQTEASDGKSELSAPRRLAMPSIPAPDLINAAQQQIESSLTLAPPSVANSSASPFPHTSFRLSSRIHTSLITRLVGVLIIGVLLVGSARSSGSSLVARGATGGRICLATEFPTTVGDDPSLAGSWGRSLEHAVQLAVDQNQSLGSGYTLEAIHYDEVPAAVASTDPKQGAQNIAAMVKTPCIMGMIGPAWSAGAVAEMPTAARAGLVMISAANTNPALTLRLYAGTYGVDFDRLHPTGKQVNYFRTIANDAFQGLEIAAFTSNSPPTGLEAKSAFVVNDHTSYGEVTDGGFTQEFLATGGRIVGTDGIPFGGAEPVAELAARIVASKADVVCFGGTTDTGGGLLEAELDRVGYAGFFVSGDGIAGDTAFINQAGAATTREVFAVNPVPDLSKMTSSMAVHFASAFHVRYPNDDLDGYGANAYDDAMLLITAIKQVIRAGRAVIRQSVLTQVQNIRYIGVTGLISFDDNGDSTHGVFSVYGVEFVQWVWMKQLSV